MDRQTLTGSSQFRALQECFLYWLYSILFYCWHHSAQISHFCPIFWYLLIPLVPHPRTFSPKLVLCLFSLSHLNSTFQLHFFLLSLFFPWGQQWEPRDEHLPTPDFMAQPAYLSLQHFSASKRNSFREGLAHFFPTSVGHATVSCRRE